MSTPLTPIDPPRDEPTLTEIGSVAETAEKTAVGYNETDTSAETTATGPEPATTDRASARTGSSLLALALGALLLFSVAINLKQSRDVAQLEARSGEYQQALAAAVERIDAEAARADGAEAALDRVDLAVDVVNERVLGLQAALDQLREATVR
jgi:hypothetical protein